jgi:hypothetical protein
MLIDDSPSQEPPADPAFPLSLAQAARVMGASPDEVCDLVRGGALPALVMAHYQAPDRPPLRFAPHDLETVAMVLADPAKATAAPGSPRGLVPAVTVVHAVVTALRAYLSERAASDRAEVAKAEKRPLLSVGRHGAVLVHVLPEVIRECALARVPQSEMGALLAVRLRLRDSVTDVLTRLGAVAVRGVRGRADEKQSWLSWWRLPQGFFSPAEMLQALDFVPFGSSQDGV